MNRKRTCQIGEEHLNAPSSPEIKVSEYTLYSYSE
jgi:hypothetical protein